MIDDQADVLAMSSVFCNSVSFKTARGQYDDSRCLQGKLHKGPQALALLQSQVLLSSLLVCDVLHQRDKRGQRSWTGESGPVIFGFLTSLEGKCSICVLTQHLNFSVAAG